jgi:hypothetical protein
MALTQARLTPTPGGISQVLSLCTKYTSVPNATICRVALRTYVIGYLTSNLRPDALRAYKYIRMHSVRMNDLLASIPHRSTFLKFDRQQIYVLASPFHFRLIQCAEGVAEE